MATTGLGRPILPCPCSRRPSSANVTDPSDTLYYTVGAEGYQPSLTHKDCREDGASNAPCESATRDKSQLDGVAFIAMELVGEGGFNRRHGVYQTDKPRNRTYFGATR
jgi:hypothetical protein